MLVASKVASRIGLLVFVPTLLLVGCGSRNLIETFCSFDFSTSREDAIRTLGEPHANSVEDGFVWYFRDKGVLDFEVLDATADFDVTFGELEIWFDRVRPTLMRWSPPNPGMRDFDDTLDALRDEDRVVWPLDPSFRTSWDFTLDSYGEDAETVRDFFKNPPCHPDRECFVDDEDANRIYKESLPEGLIPGCEVVDPPN